MEPNVAKSYVHGIYFCLNTLGLILIKNNKYNFSLSLLPINTYSDDIQGVQQKSKHFIYKSQPIPSIIL